MNEPGFPRWTEPAGLPPATIYDPAEDARPPFASIGLPTVVLLLVGEADRSWAAATAIELCGEWAHADRRVVLADFHLEDPVLQEVLGGEGREGVVDVFLYGASLSRSTRPVEKKGFDFIPTGTYTTDAQAIFRHPRWPRLVNRFRELNAVLVVFAPAEAADLGALGGWVDLALLIGAPSSPSRLTPLLVAGTDIRGMIVPARGESAAIAPAAETAVPRPAAEAEARSAAPSEPSESAEAEAERRLHLPPPPTRTPHRGHRAAVLVLWILLGAALLTAIGYAVASLRPDLVPWASVAPSAEPERSVNPVTPPAAEARPLGVALPYSVQVRAYQSFAAAHEEMLALRESHPGLLFFISPEEIQGIVYYRVMAGAVADLEAAQGVKEQLVADGTVDADEAAGDWTLIQETRYSFVLGQARSDTAASAAVDSLLARHVAAYALPVPYSDGSRRWHLYAGAFRDSISAVALQRQLGEAGLPTRFASRAGAASAPAP